MIDGLIALLSPGQENMSILELMNNSSYDEMIAVDLNEGRYKFIYNIEEKYLVPATRGEINSFVKYAKEHLVHKEDRENYGALMDPQTLAQRLEISNGLLKLQYRVKDLDIGWRWVEQYIVGGSANNIPYGICYCYIFDIQNIKNREAGITRVVTHHRAHPDALTGLIREKDFFTSAEKMLANRNINWMLLVIDLESFKLFNDWYGREAGDQVLSRIGAGINLDAEKCEGLAGYFGSDDFCLLVPEGKIDVGDLYEKIRRVVVRHGISIGFLPAIGISFSSGNVSPLNLFDQASLACQHAKIDFKTRICFFEPSMYQRTSEDYRILSDFQNALKNHEITFFLQPQCHAETGKIVGAESLARWIKPDGSVISPAAFVPILEKHGFISDLDKYIWEEVCRWYKQNMDRDLPLIPVSINVSTVDFFTLDVPEFFENLVAKYGIPHRSIKLEITESACSNESDKVRAAVQALRGKGFQVLMDDFGSGYSSLNMLRELSIDVIKLDAKFLHIRKDEMRKGISILENIVNMAKGLGLPIIVEGVEYESQLDFLQDLGCNYIQGYLFYHPMPKAQFSALLKDSSRLNLEGFVFNPNQQMRVREFLDENLFTDNMLNNVLGPVAFYNWDGENIDIVRYNQQFYEVVGIGIREFDQRRRHIQNFLYPSDRDELVRMFSEAENNKAIGARGTIRAYRPNGALVWLSLRIFFIDEDIQGKKYYVSARDVTEMQVVNSEMPGAYFRCTVTDDFELLFVSRNFLQLTGFTERDLKQKFDNRLIRMVHPNDVERLRAQAHQVAQGERPAFSPYRLIRKQGDYIYVAENSQISDRFGALCWQSMIIDVTEMMHMRNQMKLLSDFMTSTILFLHSYPEGHRYEVVVNGLGKILNMDNTELEKCLNEGTFCKMIEGHLDIPHAAYTKLFIEQINGKEREITVCKPDGERIRLSARADRVLDDKTSTEYIVEMRLVT